MQPDQPCLTTDRRSSTKEVTLLDPAGPNAIAMANGIVGDEWTLWIIKLALNGVTQYNEWLNAGPISSSVLTARLGRLVETGIMERVRYQARPPRYDYRLTYRGRQTWPILLTIWAWERTWVADPAEHLPQMVHSRCGAEFVPVLICDTCDLEVAARDVRGRLGPSGDWWRSVPSAATRRRSHRGARPNEMVTQTMALVGNRWSAALLGAAFLGATRFGEFEQRIGAPPTIVAERLRTFCEIGVLMQSPNPQRPDWVVYHLTDKGRAFYPVVAVLIEWAQRWFHSPEGPSLRMEHLACHRTFHPRLVCSACHERLRGSAVQVVPVAEPTEPAGATPVTDSDTARR